MSLTENWGLKAAVAAILIALGVGGYVAKNAATHMALRQQVANVLQEKYRAPTTEAWKHVWQDLGIPYDDSRELTNQEMQHYLDKAWAQGIQSAKPSK